MSTAFEHTLYTKYNENQNPFHDLDGPSVNASSRETTSNIFGSCATPGAAKRTATARTNVRETTRRPTVVVSRTADNVHTHEDSCSVQHHSELNTVHSRPETPEAYDARLATKQWECHCGFKAATSEEIQDHYTKPSKYPKFLSQHKKDTYQCDTCREIIACKTPTCTGVKARHTHGLTAWTCQWCKTTTRDTDPDKFGACFNCRATNKEYKKRYNQYLRTLPSEGHGWMPEDDDIYSHR